MNHVNKEGRKKIAGLDLKWHKLNEKSAMIASRMRAALQFIYRVKSSQALKLYLNHISIFHFFLKLWEFCVKSRLC